jgi:hypothetical protein
MRVLIANILRNDPWIYQDRLETIVRKLVPESKQRGALFFFHRADLYTLLRGAVNHQLHEVKNGRGFLSHLYMKVIILPRQARDKHRENSKKAVLSKAIEDDDGTLHMPVMKSPEYVPRLLTYSVGQSRIRSSQLLI